MTANVDTYLVIDDPGLCTAVGETIRTVQEDLREVAPSMFLGVPRISEKLHSAIHIKLSEAGGHFDGLVWEVEQLR